MPFPYFRWSHWSSFAFFSHRAGGRRWASSSSHSHRRHTARVYKVLSNRQPRFLAVNGPIHCWPNANSLARATSTLINGDAIDDDDDSEIRFLPPVRRFCRFFVVVLMRFVMIFFIGNNISLKILIIWLRKFIRTNKIWMELSFQKKF